MVSLGETGPLVDQEELVGDYADELEDTQGGMPDMEKYITPGEADTNGSQKVVAKLLVSNAAAGSVIGKSKRCIPIRKTKIRNRIAAPMVLFKGVVNHDSVAQGGAAIDQLQKSSKARIQLSRAGEFYPGTSERVLLLSGPLHSVLTALYLILEKVASDTSNRANQNRNNGNEQIKLALPRRLCGIVIGQKGATVRNFMADSGATIRIQSLSDLSKDDSERIVTVYGARDKVLRAVALVLNALSMDPKYNSYMETTLQLAASQGLIGPVKSLVGRSPLAQARTTISLFIPDDDVGSILGKGGQSLVKMQQAAKVKITVSDRKLMDPKMREREVSISGTHPQVRLAEAMIAEKIGQHRNQRPPTAPGSGRGEVLSEDAE